MAKTTVKESAPQETPSTPVGTTIEMAVETPGSAYDTEDASQFKPSDSSHIAQNSVIAEPEEDADSVANGDAVTGPVEQAHHALPEDQALANDSASADGDRWAGTMSREWNENEKQSVPDLPEIAPKPKTRTKPKITVEQAMKMIPADALKFIREKFKTDVQHIRSYDPANNVKNPVVTHTVSVEEKEEDLPDSES